MKNYRTKAFTLVELIVVITILAILGTIAFINLQGYSTSARDSKRISDINNIQKKIGIETSKGISISTLITSLKTNSGLTIDGVNTATSIQGTANFQALKENGDSFKDPITGDDYILSYSIGGTGSGAYKFTQISTVNEELNQAVVKGNYYQMQVGDSPSITLNPDDTYFVIDEGVDLPYEIGELASNTPSPAGPIECNYQQADIDILNISGNNGDLDVFDVDFNSLGFPLTLEQWCGVRTLWWNGGSTILPEIFTLNLLENFSVINNNLTDLPSDIGNLTNLRYLYLSDNELENLPRNIGNLTNLVYLEFMNNEIYSLPPQIGNLISLQELYGEYNNLSNLPSEIGNLTNLEYIDLNNNQLASLPSTIGDLINLTDLNLRYNQLESLPSTIGDLTNLIYLDFNNNLLTDIPSTIGGLINLSMLYLDYNQLESLPTEIGNLTNLTELYLNNNLLTSIPSSIGNLTNLLYFPLNENLLTSIPSTIGDLNSLELLSLNNNQLTNLPGEISNLTNLNSLSLSNNTLLVQLSFNFTSISANRSQLNIPTSGQTMTIGGNGTNIVISVTP